MAKSKKIRYAIVGLGHIAQAAVLPAFEHARKNSVLCALFSGDPVKRKKLSAKYGVPAYGYEDYVGYLKKGEVDAVYIASPNSSHRDQAIQAANSGVHVLCEKPMAVTEEDCRAMLEAAENNGVKLMIAYRLHFDPANLKAVQAVRSGKIGEPRYFTSSFSLQVAKGNIRLREELGGGTLYDIGVYCINAARYLFRAEPYEVFAMSSARAEGRFKEVDEMTSAILRFPGDRLATFTCSFGAAGVSNYQIVGTKGDIRLEEAYEYVGKRTMLTTIGEKTSQRLFEQTDQFAPEIIHFSDCITKDEEPQPSGYEGLEDVRIILALYESSKRKTPVALEKLEPPKRPGPARALKRPPVRKPELVHAAAASGS